MFLDYYCQSLISGRDTGHWAMSPPKLKICLIFPYFLKFQVLGPSAIRCVLKYCSRNKVPEYIWPWLSENFLFALYTLSDDSNFIKKAYLIEKC